MQIRPLSSLFLRAASSNHDYNAALRIFGPPAMFRDDLYLSAEPETVVIETNQEIYRRLTHDLTSMTNDELSAVDAYRLYRYADLEHPTWGYCFEAARNEITNDIQILFRSDDEDDLKFLDWVPLSSFYTLEQALNCDVSYAGPADEVIQELLELCLEVFEFAVATEWSYDKRIEFYHSLPLGELITREAIMAFRPILFGCPAFDGFEWTFPTLW